MNVSTRISFFIFFSLVSFYSFSQKTKEQLEKEKKENLKKIEEVNKILQETSQEKSTSLGQLSAIKQKITTTKKIVQSTSEEIGLLDGETTELESIALSLQKDLDTLKQEYAEMVYVAYKASSNFNRLVFIFSSSNFHQLTRRLKYLSHYAEERTLQVKQIDKVKGALLKQYDLLNKKIIEKNNLLVEQRREEENLEVLRTQQDAIVKTLSNKEVDLKKELIDRKKAVENMEKMLAKIIEEELKEAEREREKEKNKKIKNNQIAENNQLASSFEGSKSKLGWPVTSGFISQRFGIQEHPLLEGVQVDNFGIDIQTNKNEMARAVFNGKIKYIGFIPGLGHTVMVQHGSNYFTVYAKLANIIVKKGQLVKNKDILGEVLTDKNGISELHFEIWKNVKRLDPEQWLYRK